MNFDMADAMQSAFYIKGIKEGGEVEQLNTDMGLFFHQVDVVKVIEDLVSALKYAGDPDNGERYAIQNAEAALGMLQAFKRPSLGRQVHDYHEKENPGIHDLAQKQSIIQQIASKLNMLDDQCMNTARAIVFAIEEMFKLKGL